MGKGCFREGGAFRFCDFFLCYSQPFCVIVNRNGGREWTFGEHYKREVCLSISDFSLSFFLLPSLFVSPVYDVKTAPLNH